MLQVTVLYGETNECRRALQCASDAARLFGDRPLSVYIAHDPRADEVFGSSDHAFDIAQEERALASVQKLSGVHAPRVIGFYEHPASIEDYKLVVSRSHGKLRQKCHVLHPAHEPSLDKRGYGPIMVPFSDGETGLQCATVAFQLAERRRRVQPLPEEMPEIVFYHTTWVNPAAVSSDPVDHMCDSALRVMLSIQKMAAQRGIRYRTIVETHDDVVQGVLEMAPAVGAFLICVARGARIRQGSYVVRMLEQSPIPCLVVGDDTPRVCEPAGDVELAHHKTERLRLAESAKAGKETCEGPCAWRRWISNKLPILCKPMFAVGVGAVSYLIKSVAKVAIGVTIASPMITGDGFHNMADLLQAAALALAVLIAARPTNGRYPWGRRNIEWMTQLGIGLMLFGAAFKFILDCGIGLLSCWPAGDSYVRSIVHGLPSPEVLSVNATTFPIVMAITGFSFLASLVVSRYQVLVGIRNGSAGLVAGGKEMASDGWIELVTLCGIAIEYVTGWRFLEYPLGLFVAGLIIHTAWELVHRGWQVLLQHSLGEETERAVHEACLTVAGVESVGGLKTFQTGDTAVVIVVIESIVEAQATDYVKKAVGNAICKRLLTEEAQFKSVDIHITVQRPQPKRHRIGYPLLVSGQSQLIAPDLASATHLAVCDIEHGDPVRTKVIDLTSNPVALLLKQRISKLYAFAADEEQSRKLEAEARTLLGDEADKGVIPLPRLAQSTCYLPLACGVEV